MCSAPEGANAQNILKTANIPKKDTWKITWKNIIFIYIYTHTNMYRNNMKQSSTALHKSAWNRFWNHNLHPWRGQVASGWIIVSDPEKVDRLSIMRLFGRETEEAERMERNLWPSSSIQDSGVLWYYFAPHDLDATALKPTFSTVLPLPNNATQYADSLAHESHRTYMYIYIYTFPNSSDILGVTVQLCQSGKLCNLVRLVTKRFSLWVFPHWGCDIERRFSTHRRICEGQPLVPQKSLETRFS